MAPKAQSFLDLPVPDPPRHKHFTTCQKKFTGFDGVREPLEIESCGSAERRPGVFRKLAGVRLEKEVGGGSDHRIPGHAHANHGIC